MAEQCRRRKEEGEANPLFNKQVVRQKLLDYLQKHPIINAADVSFVKGETLSFISKAQALQQRQNSDDAKRWSGPAPFERLCHAVTDVPQNKAVFEDSFRSSTREELDGRSNPETARPNAWGMSAGTWNSQAFGPACNVYHNSHPDLAKPLDISYQAVVVKMGELTAEKAKDKFMEMKNAASIVVARHRLSGGGDGQRASEERDFQRDENDAPIITMENNYSGNLKSFGTHVLYFLKHIVAH